MKTIQCNKKNTIQYNTETKFKKSLLKNKTEYKKMKYLRTKNKCTLLYYIFLKCKMKM